MRTSQLAALIALRWRMVRSRRARWGFAALASAVPALCGAAVAVGILAPRDSSFDVLLIAPTAYLSVALIAVLAPLVAGGGNELFPADQLSAYPVTARTQYALSLALTPLNLAWTTQLVGLVGLTSYVTPRGPWLPLSIAVCLGFVGLVTVAGQSLAWVVVGVRQRQTGRRVSWAVAVLIVMAVLSVIAAGLTTRVLDRAPTTDIVITAINSSVGPSGSWWAVMGVLALLTATSYVAGRRACSWALGRSGDAAGRLDSRTVSRRPGTKNARSELLAIDRASVWRSQSLRRGFLVLGVLPGIVAAMAGLDWTSLVLLPGLVAAGAGLLFGVNAFCLDGSGAPWLASLPQRPETAFWSKAQVIAEVCLVAVLVTLMAGSLRAGGLPSAGEAAAILGCTVVTSVRVVATCMGLSVLRPHRADLRGPRDTPAPPGVMAAYSARLAVSTTLVALLFSAIAEVGSWQWSVAWALPLCLLSARRLVRAAHKWDDPGVRARVVATVAAG
ncbi:MAG: hypothetical protein ACRDWY_01140 [Actinomycetes bacterium]